MEAAYNALKQAGARSRRSVKFITFGGDGGTYDIGFQSLSGAMERGHDMVYVCYDNEAYMNTGIQRSSSTPRVCQGHHLSGGVGHPREAAEQEESHRDHRRPPCALRGPDHLPWQFPGPLHQRPRRRSIPPAPAFLNVHGSLSPRLASIRRKSCPEICKLAVETCVWPLFEVIDGVWHLSYQPKQKRPVEEYLRLQGRFRHMFKPGNEWMIEEAQRNVDENGKSSWPNVRGKM